jgi:hypothetical protein
VIYINNHWLNLHLETQLSIHGQSNCLSLVELSSFQLVYFEFVRSASVGFGDIIPEDEYTLVGAIFKNILVNIPGQIVTFAIFVRALPLIS